MRKPSLMALLLAVLAVATSYACAAANPQSETIIGLERAALDRWGKGDPQGYLETYAPDITYFDPMQERRIDGLAAMNELVRPLTGKIEIDRYEMIGPNVQRHGDVAVLTYNLVSRATRPGGEAVTTRWNSTAVYARSGGPWRIIHSHWSYTRPDANPPRGQ